MGPGAGAMKSPDAGAMVGQIESQKSQVKSQIEGQKAQAIEKTKKSIAERIGEYKTRRESILKSIADVRSKLSSIPDNPQTKSIREKLKKQLNQLREALSSINSAIDMISGQIGKQESQIKEQFEKRKKEVLGNLDEQKKNILVKIAAQKMMMKKQMQMLAERQKNPEGGKMKG